MDLVEATQQICSGRSSGKRKQLMMTGTHNPDEMLQEPETIVGHTPETVYLDHQYQNSSQLVPYETNPQDTEAVHEAVPEVLPPVAVSESDCVAECTMPVADRLRELQIKMEWFVEFDWLEFDEMSEKLLCRFCKYCDPCGVFSVGKPAAQSNYEDIKKHNSSEPHRQSIVIHMEQFPDATNEMPSSRDIGASEFNNETLPHHWTILFPWMQHDKALDILYCQACQRDGTQGSWVEGVPRAEVTLTNIEDHEQLVSHRTAVVQQKRKHLETLTAPLKETAGKSPGVHRKFNTR